MSENPAKDNSLSLSSFGASFKKPYWKQDARNRLAIPDAKHSPQQLVFDGGIDFIDTNHGYDNWFLQIEAFDPGMIANAAYYVKKGVLKTPLHFQFCMGCANGIPGNTKNLVFMKETMDQLCPGSTWSCFGVGHSAMEIMYAAIALGGNIRVGMEDNVMYAKGQLADSNKQFIERAVRVIREFGCEPATPDEARQILGLK